MDHPWPSNPASKKDFAKALAEALQSQRVKAMNVKQVSSWRFFATVQVKWLCECMQLFPTMFKLMRLILSSTVMRKTCHLCSTISDNDITCMLLAVLDFSTLYFAADSKWVHAFFGGHSDPI